jgi:hypothetical protein
VCFADLDLSEIGTGSLATLLTDRSLTHLTVARMSLSVSLRVVALQN